MKKTKIVLTLSLLWIITVGYLVWINGLKAPGIYKGFRWDEWFWFGVVPAIAPHLFLFIWKPSQIINCIRCIKSAFSNNNPSN